MLDKFSRSVRENPSLLNSVVAILLLEGFVAILIRVGVLNFDKSIGIAVFGGLPVLLLTLIQIYNGSVVQRASLVKDLAAKLYTDRDLADTFHSLVYAYDDRKFDVFVKSDLAARDEMNKDRDVGFRYFDPEAMAGSEEERRLDALLGYLDIIAYHNHRQLIHMRDVAGVLGYHLAIVGNRKAITAYRDSIPEFWKGTKYEKMYGTNSAPLRYLDGLLRDYQSYCERQQRSVL